MMNLENLNDYSISLSAPSSGTEQRLTSYNTFESIQTPLTLSSPTQLVSPKKRAGRKKFKETRHPIYRGVREGKKHKWVCEVRSPNSKSRIWLGTHSTPEMAARAYDVAAIALRGHSAPLNFVDSLWLLPRAKTSSAEDIQYAIREAVQAFPLPAGTTPSSVMKRSPQSKLTNLSRLGEDNVEEVHESTTFLDEEAIFNMPSLLASMAEGMLLDPPQEGYFLDDVECSVDYCSLWSD